MSSDSYQGRHEQDEAVLRAAYGANTAQLLGTAPQPLKTPSRWDPAHWSTRAKLAAAGGLAALVLIIVLAVALWPSGGVPSTIHGTITSTEVAALAGVGGAGNCILNLPANGSALTFKADGVAVATAQLGKNGSRKFSGGEVCWEDFTFPNVPGNASSYAVVVNANNSYALGSYGCTGTIYFTPARLATGKPIGLTCS
jgi:hypothetical protein